ncbi:MAG TPA: GNAT family N-acetyltransferase, partial [Anaerolineae bacterium]|nr:GNAT family N-acetyltransferase [Anaerolineae bacterium]
MTLRPYNPAKDREAAQRIFCEVGWSDRKAEQEEAIDLALSAGPTFVAELAGAAESLVATAPATYRYLEEDLPLCAVTDVVTSHVARKEGLASRLTALSLARAAGGGSLVAMLGVFEHGYYDRLGFGAGAYGHYLSFDPALLRVKVPHRPPQRITIGDWEVVHALRLGRPRGHGAVSLHPAALTRAEMLDTSHGFGLGYHDGPGGALSHYVWLGTRAMEHGPIRVRWLVYHSRGQFLELMAILKSLGDQIHLAGMVEPPGMQLHDLLETPFKQRQVTEKSPYEAVARATPWWQMRLLDVAGALARTHLAGPALRFNLRLADPIARYLSDDEPWRGVTGDYVVTLGPNSAGERGVDPG